MNKYCQRCGSMLNDDVKFCNSCENQVDLVRQPPAKNQKGLWVVFAILLLVALALIFLIPTNKKEKKIFNEKDFEQIGYSKIVTQSGAIIRSFVIYTTQTDEDVLIAYAREFPYTKYGSTYIHFYNQRELAPNNSNFPLGINYTLEGYGEGRTLIYHRIPLGAKWILDSKMEINTPIESKT